MSFRIQSIAFCTFLAVLSEASAAGDDADFVEQDFLFQFEEAYTQEAGEWQVAGGFDRSFGPSGSLAEFEVEYGVTRRLEISAELPVVTGPGEAGAGDVEFGVDYALLMDEGRSPALTVGFLAGAPTGEEEAGRGVGGWTYEASLRASKRFHPNVYGHVMGAYEWVPNGGGEADELTAWEFGAGAAWRASDLWTFIVEYLRESERTEEAGFVERETQSYLSLGAIAEIVEGVAIGAAGAVGVGGESADARLLVRIQIEW